MSTLQNSVAVDWASLDDMTLVELAKRGHRDGFRHIMQRCNQRLFRVARGVVHDDAEAEDVVQAAYLHAFEKLDTFRGDAMLLTWMTRIVLNEAYGRLRRRRPRVDLDRIDAIVADKGQVVPFPSRFGDEDPAACTARTEIRRLLEHAIDDLPEPFRVVFVMREIEECTVEETAHSLDLRAETVKTRLHRARRLLRTALHDTLSSTLTEAFPFLGTRCQRMTDTVLARLEPRLAARTHPHGRRSPDGAGPAAPP